jgi:hypothetical protein
MMKFVAAFLVLGLLVSAGVRTASAGQPAHDQTSFYPGGNG